MPSKDLTRFMLSFFGPPKLSKAKKKNGSASRVACSFLARVKYVLAIGLLHLLNNGDWGRWHLINRV